VLHSSSCSILFAYAERGTYVWDRLPREASRSDQQAGGVALEVALRYSDELLSGVTSLLIIIPLITAGSDCDSLGLPFQPPLVAFGAPLAAGSHLPTALDKDDPIRLLTRGMPGGDVEELLRALWLVTTELMHYGLIVHVRPQC
jgi:hypothetical protein